MALLWRCQLRADRGLSFDGWLCRRHRCRQQRQDAGHKSGQPVQPALVQIAKVDPRLRFAIVPASRQPCAGSCVTQPRASSRNNLRRTDSRGTPVTSDSRSADIQIRASAPASPASRSSRACREALAQHGQHHQVVEIAAQRLAAIGQVFGQKLDVVILHRRVIRDSARPDRPHCAWSRRGRASAETRQ